MDLETAYLEHILLHLTSNDPDDSALSMSMNSWHAHSRGVPFVNGGGKPRWLSVKASKRLLAPHVHAISQAAKRALAEGRLDDLVIDHAIPSAELIRGLRARQRSQPFADTTELRNYLKRRFTLALLTHAEHNNSLRLYRATMVAGWCDNEFECDQSTRYCRYGPDAADIEYEVQIAHE